jgi:DNA (cytosine-5)-methyltransferase 1
MTVVAMAVGRKQTKNRNGCYQCGSNLHRAKECTSIDSPCRHCGETGHITGSCPSIEPQVDMGSFNASPRKFRYVELFAGVGGFRLALDRMGGQCVFASEIDRFARKNYELNHLDRPAGDITKISARLVPDHDLLVGGFPCQAFSSSGTRLGFDDERGILFLEIVRILRQKKPKAVLLENVRGLGTHDEGRTLQHVISELEQSGYIMRYKEIDAVCLVPQERKRIYLIGIRQDLDTKVYRYPDVDVLERRGFVDVMEKSLNEDSLRQLSLSSHQLAKVKSQNYTQRFPEARFLFDTSCPTKTLQSSYSSYMVGSQFVPAPPETTSGWRRLTPREAARLQGFPEHFQLCPSRPYHLLGNAVVPSMIALVAAPLLLLLYPSGEPLNWEKLGWKVAFELLLDACPRDERKDKMHDALAKNVPSWEWAQNDQYYHASLL